MKKKTMKNLEKRIKLLQYYKLQRRHIDKKIAHEFKLINRISRGHAKDHLAIVGKENALYNNPDLDID